MLPRWHIIYGLLFVIVLALLAPGISWVYLALVLFAAVMIDLDHYLCFFWNTKKISMRHAFEYHKKQGQELLAAERRGHKPRSDFHFFHTIEFHLLVAGIGLVWIPAFYLFIGMVFHSLLDIFSLVTTKTMHRREYFFCKWLQRRF